MTICRRVLLPLAAMLATGCVTQTNYDGPGPRYSGVVNGDAAAQNVPDTIRIVSYNIEFAFKVDSAIVVLADPLLRNADIVLLQEMDAHGAERIASALGMHHVYYPATKHMRTGRDFGNAVLSRWPIRSDAKILLPHLAAIGESRRIATAATIEIGEMQIRVYSAHLGTVANINADQRTEQFETLLADAAPFDRVIIGGDMNDPDIGSVARDRGYAWPTAREPRTAKIGRLDHVFLKGLAPARENGSGTIVDNHHASDHKPIWALAILR
ncbi:MAG: endonuclease/exonuclease/phosphatase family protein [Longimicrobiales bacterium]